MKDYYSPEALEDAAKKEARIASLIAVKQYLEDKKRLQIITE